MKMLEDKGVPVKERLKISEACPLVLPFRPHDVARETAKGIKAIGTTGRGIEGRPMKTKCRAEVCVSDLFNAEGFAIKLKK
jgi:adenylosuccinate synthase